MYPVSEAFLQAVQENTRRYYWTGRITTTKGAIYEFGADDIVKGSGYISSQCCGSTEIELGTVYTGDCLAAIMGQSMGAGEAWDGEIRLTETIKKVKVGGVLQMAAVDENITWKIDELVKRTYSDVVHSDVVKYYRVRKSWDDAKSQLGAYTILANAKAMADKHPGYEVYDWNGKQVYPEMAEGVTDGMTNADCPFMVKVSIPDLNIRKGSGTNTAKTGQYTGVGVFTILEVKDGKGSDKGWGKLKSGAGWISLDYCQRV